MPYSLITQPLKVTHHTAGLDFVVNADALDEDIKDLFYQLLGVAESADNIIHKLRESAWFQTALQAAQMSLLKKN